MAASESSSRPRPALEAAGVRPSKSRGQNFLTSAAVAERIVAAAELEASDDVIEIGPGLGILTERIAARPHRQLTLIELDARLASRLRDKFAGDGSVRVINADFLEADAAEIFATPMTKVIGNLPFNVAAAILRRLSETSNRISRMVLMFQREVAARIRARAGDDQYSALSVYTAMYWEIDLHFVVAAGSFHPRPKVNAEVLRFRPRRAESKLFAADEEQAVLSVVRASFSAPRKTIRNSLAHGLALDAEKIASALGAAGIKPDARAETLGVGDFVRLARALGSELRSRFLIQGA
ncbi:MAG: 16S rRNA (adenine(1518)-N(6)/adenine(1519)-N(6))-dimethyltransferase RsmA [Candidatus Binatus sp.]|uniref:16S rRNA (adenine(1518)-N(6)/adenine(1519)-N(6))- dimethyltransferase RsmA n=1 Tax=Candidatus Binatus sp. TaxID=2811406 RepID=UPI002724C309|nr:16S rRNA (adenine(1518)-N(6)/adenine(1519)-N(6))-dimethyltransferase RsmA [Candidatus Binatus sp.]MDO8433994.1 16S rRNA (adenine(1518)-N(6)/adenine(1519)-N(6))-dimethyltransferase RsmA [Candidatus Binatus sp.]